jgi:hypothetical protein
MKIKSKPTNSNCNLAIYILFLLSEPKYVSCVRLSEIFNNLSHDSVNRFLITQTYKPQDLFDQVKEFIVLRGGTLSVDDMVIDKPYSNHLKSDLIDYFWSGKHHKTVKGINIITLYYTDVNGISMPINYRIINKQESKTKHEYFLEMLEEITQWGLFPLMITGDSWYGKKETLKFFKDKEQNFLFAIKSNRQVSEKNKKFVSVKDLEIPEEGLVVYLKEFGTVKVFKKMFKNEYRYYAIWLSNTDELNKINTETFNSIHDKHWAIEQYHRALKQVCNIERFQVRKTEGIKTHIFSSIIGFIQLELARFNSEIINWYDLKRNMFNEIIRSFILNHLPA